MERDLSGIDEPTTFEMAREIADHEVFIVFVNDDDALEFRNWLAAEGWYSFANWKE